MDAKVKPVIKVFDTSLNFVASVSEYETCSFERNLYEPGQFTIEINYNLPQADAFQTKRIVQFGDDGRDSGIITSVAPEIGEDGKGSQKITVSGYDLRYLFKQRIVYYLNTDTAFYLSAPGETVIKTLVSYQCGPDTTIAKRKFTALAIAEDQGRGDTYAVSEKFSNLLSVLETVATQSKTGWYVSFDAGNKSFMLECFSLSDKSATSSTPPYVVFDAGSPTLKEGTLTDDTSSYGNLIFVGGTGTGTSREFYTGYDTDEPEDIERFEVFDDASSLSDTADMETEAKSVLSEYNQTVSVSGNSLAESQYVYKTDYDVGDYIQIKFTGRSEKVLVLSVTEAWEFGDYSIEFDLGKPIKGLTSQVGRLATNATDNNAKAESGTNTNALVTAKNALISYWKKIFDYSDEDDNLVSLPSAVSSMVVTGELYSMANSANNAAIWTPTTSGTAAYVFYNAAESLRAYFWGSSGDPGPLYSTQLTSQSYSVTTVTNLEAAYAAAYSDLHGSISSSKTNAYSISLNSGSFSRARSNLVSPSTITATATKKTGDSSILYSGRWVIKYTTDGVTYTTGYESTTDESSTLAYSIPFGTTNLKIFLYASGGTILKVAEQDVFISYSESVSPIYLGIGILTSTAIKIFVGGSVDANGAITAGSSVSDIIASDWMINYSIEHGVATGIYYWDGTTWNITTDQKYITGTAHIDVLNLKTGGIEISGYMVILNAIIKNLSVTNIQLQNKLYHGAGNYANADTPIFLGLDGGVAKFSLGTGLQYDGANLALEGYLDGYLVNKGVKFRPICSGRFYYTDSSVHLVTFKNIASIVRNSVGNFTINLITPVDIDLYYAVFPYNGQQYVWCQDTVLCVGDACMSLASPYPVGMLKISTSELQNIYPTDPNLPPEPAPVSVSSFDLYFTDYSAKFYDPMQATFMLFETF